MEQNNNNEPQSIEPTSAAIAANPMLSAALSTREANLLIASFMGYDDYKQTGAVIKDASIKFVLTYDLNWSELMPVIEKIEAIKANPNHSYGDYYVKLSQCNCRIHRLHNQPVAEANGDYINYLQMENTVIVPTFGIKEDDEAIKQFETLFAGQTIATIDSNEIANDGGILNCITWNILK